MPKISLEIKANLENVTNLRPEEVDFRWYMKLKCSSCGEEPNHWQYVSLDEMHEISGSRGSAHLVEKCKLCRQQNTLDPAMCRHFLHFCPVFRCNASYENNISFFLCQIVKDSYFAYKIENNLKFQRMVTFDCRGIEPTDFDPRIGWTAEGVESGTVFREIDLGEKEWAEYDERAKLPVEINEWEHRFVLSR